MVTRCFPVAKTVGSSPIRVEDVLFLLFPAFLSRRGLSQPLKRSIDD